MKQPKLNQVPLNPDILCKPSVNMTMSPGQWDSMLEAAYKAGWTLIEVDQTGRPSKAYRRAEA